MAGGQRRYTRYEIRVIQQVVSMADEGITLQAIRRIIELERQLAVVTAERDELARTAGRTTSGPLVPNGPGACPRGKCLLRQR